MYDGTRGAVRPSRHATSTAATSWAAGRGAFRRPASSRRRCITTTPTARVCDQIRRRPRHRRHRRAAAAAVAARHDARVRRRLPRRRAATISATAALLLRSAGPDHQRSAASSRRTRSPSRRTGSRSSSAPSSSGTMFTGYRDAAERAAALDAVGAADGVGRGVARGADADALRHRSPLHQPDQRRRHADRQRPIRDRESDRLRGRLSRRLARRASFDLAAYTNVYDDLRSQELPTSAGQPVVLANLMNARTSGSELSATLLPSPSGGCTRRTPTCTKRSPSIRRRTTRPGGVNESNDPSHIFKLRSSVDLPRRLELDALLRCVTALPHPVVPGLRRADARLGWHRAPALGAVAGRPEPAARAPPRIPARRAPRARNTSGARTSDSAWRY